PPPPPPPPPPLLCPLPDPGGLHRGRRQRGRAGGQGVRPRHRGRGRPPGRRGRVQAPTGPARPQDHRALLRQGPPPPHHQPVPGGDATGPLIRHNVAVQETR